MTTRKFWCHYIGNDGNTPKRRSIELTDIHELLPSISNEGAKTPVWYEYDEDEKSNYLYVQLSESVATEVAVWPCPCVVRQRDIEECLTKSDDDLDKEYLGWHEQWLQNHPDATDAEKEESKRRSQENADGMKYHRDRILNGVRALQDYDNVLLASSHIPLATIKAYEEVKSPILSGLQEIRRMSLERREEERKREAEEKRKREEEEARKLAEAEQKEQERLTQEAEKFKAGESISGDDVVELCRRYGIAIHLRTVHNLQQVVANINGKDGTCQYYRQRCKRRPQLDGCYKTAEELYKYLQEH
jgi:hypothetical protein